MNLVKLQDTNTQKFFFAFLYTSNERSERKTKKKKKKTFIITSKRIKYPGIKLPKEAKIPCSKN